MLAPAQTDRGINTMKKQYIQFSADAAEATGVAATQETNSNLTLVVPSLEDLMAAVEDLDDKDEAVTITAVYKEFTTPGETARGIFFGYRDGKFKDDNATTEAGGEQQYTEGKLVVWMTKDKKCFCAAGKALVGEFERNNIPVGSSVVITYTGKKERTKVFTVGLTKKK